MTLTTRKPTGKPPWPIICIAGAEKAGKSYACAQASSSPLIDRTFWIGIGEDDPDEYGAIPGARFEIIPHTGAYSDILSRLKEAVAEPAAEGKQNLIVIDSGTRLWEMLSDEANHRAVARAKRAAAKYNRAFDPDGEVTIGTDLWNKSTDRWRAIMDQLRLHSGPSIITARLDIVTIMDKDGKPTKDKTSKIKAQKSLPFDVGVVVEIPERGKAAITGARSLKIDLPLGERMDIPDFTVEGIWRGLGITDPGATSERQHSNADGAAGAAEDEPQDAPPAGRESAPAQTLRKRQEAQVVDWDAELLRSRNNIDMLRDLHQKASRMGAPQAVIESITAAGKALSERAAA